MPEISEASQVVPEPVGNRWRARIIEGDRWGSSGYYPADVLERDGATTWPQGTAVFFDHPGETERYDRPERSVRDLAGRIASTPAYEGDGLYADIEFYSHAAPIVKEMAGDIGLSIRAAATIENGEAAGKSGPIIKALHEGLSVDLVTKAGAGGKLVSLMESARPLLVIDEAPARPQVPATDPTNIPPIAAESVPAPAGQPENTHTPNVQEDTMGTIQVDEAEHGRLAEAAGRVPTLEAERDAAIQERDQAIAERDELREADIRRRRETAAIVALNDAVREAGIYCNTYEQSGLLADLPVTESGDLDADTFKDRVDRFIAEKAEQAGAGKVHGFGAHQSKQSVTEADFAQIDAVFGVKEA